MTGEELKRIRLGLNVSRASLAKMLGYSPKAIYQWETGRRRIPDILAITFRLMPKSTAAPYQKPLRRR